MKKTYRPYERRQSLMFPPSPLDWLPVGHLARFVLDVVEQLDLSEIFAYYEREQRGFPPHHPKMMTGLLLYAYCVGVPSSRKIEKRCHEDVAFRVIAATRSPIAAASASLLHRRRQPDHEDRRRFIQGYNCQAAVDAEHQIVVAEAVTNQPPDESWRRSAAPRCTPDAKSSWSRRSARSRTGASVSFCFVDWQRSAASGP